jgi:hypothetical protein
MNLIIKVKVASRNLNILAKKASYHQSDEVGVNLNPLRVPKARHTARIDTRMADLLSDNPVGTLIVSYIPC